MWQRAQTLWGRLAFANHSLHPGTFYVGVAKDNGKGGACWDVKGKGSSWDEAFADADSREKEEK